MAYTEEQVLEIINPKSSGLKGRRFTQDTPVLPDVWILFGTKPGQFHDLILTPHKDCDVQTLFTALKVRTLRESERRPEATFQIHYNDTHVIFRTDYEGLVRLVLPLSHWWRERVLPHWKGLVEGMEGLFEHPKLRELLIDPCTTDKQRLEHLTQSVLDMIRIVGAIGLVQREGEEGNSRVEVLDLWNEEFLREGIRYIQNVLWDVDPYDKGAEVAPLWQLFSDRKVESALMNSRGVVKADAAHQVFQIDTGEIRWAVIDSGIDATHPAFQIKGVPFPEFGSFAAATRVVRTLDFNRLRELTSISIRGGTETLAALQGADRERIVRDFQERLRRGQSLDWGILGDLLEIPHVRFENPTDEDRPYQAPTAEHGTHVAGILGADWPSNPKGPMYGICPQIGIYDLRVTDSQGAGSESTVLAALQFVRFLNANKGRLVVHGVNLSLSMVHKVESFACGCTPVCDEATRLVKAGIVVVAAAGNSGMGNNAVGAATDYRAMSITDPGNAEAVITVGSTHNSMPHRFGVSYFSSRGPTGDGRMKPDLVAPGEGIRSTIPGGKTAVLDGTSQAAPHVSGAAALLMARHKELRGDPERVKQILCDSATDLRREKTFQGAGIIDILRALQSV